MKKTNSRAQHKTSNYYHSNPQKIPRKWDSNKLKLKERIKILEEIRIQKQKAINELSKNSN